MFHFFVDGIIFFVDGKGKPISTLKNMLENFESGSRLCMNAKGNLFLLFNVNDKDA